MNGGVVNPVVRYMLLCDDVRPDPDHPNCSHVECLMSNIVSLEDPHFPLLREMICVYLVLTECRGKGRVQVRVSYVDTTPEQVLFGTPEHEVNFSGVDPLETVGIPFRIRDCRFPQAGRYSVQFWYNGTKLEERPLGLRGPR
jgi:hypothetical protein